MRTVIKTYKFKLYQSKKNKYLDRSINTAASIWNYCIAMHRRYYRLYGKHLSAKKLKNHITKVKKTLHSEFPRCSHRGSTSIYGFFGKKQERPP